MSDAELLARAKAAEPTIGDTITVRLPHALKSREPLRPSLPTVLDDIWRRRHTGPVTFHFSSGRPIKVDFPQEPMTIRLDTERREAQSYEATVESR